MSGVTSIALIAATGNRFALVDGFKNAVPDDPGALAIALGRRDDLAVDGLLQLLPPALGGDVDCRMAIHNIDGSLAEACGNGIRCVARVAVERGHVAGPKLRVETEAGVRAVEITSDATDDFRVRAEMGRAAIEDLSASIAVREGEIEVAILNLGNPHCVLFIPEITHAPVASIGSQLEGHARFKERTNVEFADVRGDELLLRVWERGVGETRSCGSGACAAVAAAIARGRIASPVRVVLPGGELVVEWNGEEDSSLWLEGGVGAIEEEIDPAP